MMEHIKSLGRPRQTSKVAVSPPGCVCSQVSQDPAFPSLLLPAVPRGTGSWEKSLCGPGHRGSQWLSISLRGFVAVGRKSGGNTGERKLFCRHQQKGSYNGLC